MNPRPSTWLEQSKSQIKLANFRNYLHKSGGRPDQSQSENCHDHDDDKYISTMTAVKTATCQLSKLQPVNRQTIKVPRNVAFVVNVEIRNSKKLQFWSQIAPLNVHRAAGWPGAAERATGLGGHFDPRQDKPRQTPRALQQNMRESHPRKHVWASNRRPMQCPR